MARKSLVLISFLILFSTSISSANGRKLLTISRRRNHFTTAAYGSLYLAALPKGTVPASTPSKRGHASINDEKLVNRHLAAVDRILRAVPSPGAGH